MKNLHTPVLINTIINQLENIWQVDIWEDRQIFDGTFGGGGYSHRFLQKQAQAFACDKDISAINLARQNFTKSLQSKQLNLVESDFLTYIKTFTNSFFDLIVLDLGFSSNQLEFSNRGFSFLKPDEEFDLRYNLDNPVPCWQKIKNLRKPEFLKKIIYSNSGELSSSRIAKTIYQTIRAKKNTEITTVGDIVKALDQEILNKKTPKQRTQTLARVWQALRIWTNKELEILELFIDQALPRLKPGGVLAIVSFHSLEDKIVTKKMRKASKPKDVDEFGNKTQDFKLLTSKAILPTLREIKSNPSSRSAKLRILQKV